jgi:hypothetical protein
VRLANDSQRHVIYGKTGSGKTVAGLWALEKRSFTRMPWIIMDMKRDSTIARIPRLEEIDINDRIPKQAGLYVVRPIPDSRDEIDKFLWRVWSKGRTGLMIDEGYMIHRLSKPWGSILTQGRSLKIPVIALTQRPAWVSPFLMSEADFHQPFFLQNPADLDRLADWNVPVPRDQNFHSYYYDVPKNKLDYLGPVPNEDEILDRFDSKVPRRIKLMRGIMSNAPRGRVSFT